MPEFTINDQIVHWESELKTIPVEFLNIINNQGIAAAKLIQRPLALRYQMITSTITTLHQFKNLLSGKEPNTRVSITDNQITNELLGLKRFQS